ncbi:MAG TPA: response regulator, partial [Acidimicrobiia bacterium]|nr:response regulator [Acidimicrobiia bacterium]
RDVAGLPREGETDSMSRILVVDDEPDPRLVVRIALEGEGHDVIEAASGEEALEVLNTEHVELVLLDIRMPGIDGWEVLRRLKAENRVNGMGVLLVSAFADPEVGARATQEGCRGFLAKPFRLAQLVDEVQRALAAA